MLCPSRKNAKPHNLDRNMTKTEKALNKFIDCFSDDIKRLSPADRDMATKDMLFRIQILFDSQIESIKSFEYGEHISGLYDTGEAAFMTFFKSHWSR